MATTFSDPASNGEALASDPPANGGRKRLRLDSVDRIRHELGKLYHDARDGGRERVETIEARLQELAGP